MNTQVEEPNLRAREYTIQSTHITALALLRRHRADIESVLGEEFSPALAVPLIAAGIVRDLGDDFWHNAEKYAYTMRMVSSALKGTKPLAANGLLERAKSDEEEDGPMITTWNWTAIEAFLEVAKVYSVVNELQDMPCKAHVVVSDKSGGTVREEVRESKVGVVGDAHWDGEVFA